jgi:hypothetical protein
MALKGKKQTPEHIAKRAEAISRIQKGRKLTPEWKEKIRQSALRVGSGKWMKGRKASPELRLKLSLAKRGEKGNNWQGGITPINTKIRNSLEYRLWRESVFERDNWTCVFCGIRGGKLNADHIKPFSLFPELRFAIDNGRTLCVACHKTTDTYMGKIQIYKKNWTEVR